MTLRSMLSRSFACSASTIEAGTTESAAWKSFL
jgi:hypothetical protein